MSLFDITNHYLNKIRYQWLLDKTAEEALLANMEL